MSRAHILNEIEPIKISEISLTSPKTPKYTKCFIPLIAKNFEPYIDAQKPASELIL
jgi:hypothetical protein